MAALAIVGSGQQHNQRRFEQLIGNSPALEAVLGDVERVAPTDATVLLQGETGTGKELIAGAIAQKVGRFELADKGTLFLDEVGDIPLALQAKLLRVLQEQEFERLGSARTHQVDVRLVAATNRNLKE